MKKTKDTEPKIDFGFSKVNKSEKQGLVAHVFDSVASRYDMMNDVMSFGVHRLWKRMTIAHSGVKAGDVVLDLASGSGDIAMAMAKKVTNQGKVHVSDINASMLAQARKRFINAGQIDNVNFAIINAESLPFDADTFDVITIGFGLRNVTNKDKALEQMYRCLKPGGKVLVLEFSKVDNPQFAKLYDMFSFSVIPKMGQWIANDKDSYQYLVESIRQHPSQDVLQQMMYDAGFDKVRYHNFTQGVVALHIGYKF